MTTTTTNQVIMQTATKAAYVAIRTIYRKNPTREMRELFDSISQVNRELQAHDTTVNSMAADLIQVAALELLESNDFLLACKAVNRAIYASGQNKGRKRITHKELLPHGDCYSYRNGLLASISPAKDEYTYSGAYEIQLTTLDATIEKPFQRSAYELQAIDDNAHDAITDLLGNDYHNRIVNYLSQGYTQKEIAELLGKSTSSINDAINRIRIKIAASGEYDNSEYVREYTARKLAK